MAGQVRKIVNPETLPEERFYGTTFETLIPIFLEFKVVKKFAKNANTAFCLIKYATNIWKIDKVLGIRIETIYKTKTRAKLSIIALLFYYLTTASFKFFKHFEGFCRPSKILPFQVPLKTANMSSFTGLKHILVCPIGTKTSAVQKIVVFTLII